MEMQRKDRARALKKAFANPLEIHLPAWNPDRFFGAIVKPLGFLFTRTACWVYRPKRPTASSKWPRARTAPC